MAERINIGDSFYKEVEVTYTNDGEEEAVDLSIYNDNYVTLKPNRDALDSEAYIFKAIPIKGSPEDGTLIINLTPDETSLLPATSSDSIPYIYGFVQIGSSVTGQIHEVSEFKIKTRNGGIGHITQIDKDYDMGCIAEQVGWIHDAGRLCDQTTEIIIFDDHNDGLLLYNGGSITATEIEIIDPGKLDLEMPEVIDLGYIRECTGLLTC